MAQYDSETTEFIRQPKAELPNLEAEQRCAADVPQQACICRNKV